MRSSCCPPYFEINKRGIRFGLPPARYDALCKLTCQRGFHDRGFHDRTESGLHLGSTRHGCETPCFPNREHRPGGTNNMWEAKFLSAEVNISAWCILPQRQVDHSPDGGFLLIPARRLKSPLKLIFRVLSLKPCVMLSILDNGEERAYARAIRGEARRTRQRRQSHGKEETKQGYGSGAFESSLVRFRMGRARRVVICASGDGRGKLRSDGGAQRGREDARWRNAASGYLPAEGGWKIPRAAGAHAIRQDRDDALWVEGGGAGLRGDRARCARALRIGGGVVHVQV